MSAEEPLIVRFPSSVQPPEGKIEEIQVLRGISILLVLLQHFSLPATLLGRLPTRVEMPFYLGVEIFFIISGYVITRSLVRDGFHAGRFFLRRALRLLPAMLTCLGMSLAIVMALGLLPISEAARAELVRNGFLLPIVDFLREIGAIVAGVFTLLPGASSYYHGAMWSLSIEDQFYWTLGLICLIAGGTLRMGSRWVGRLILTASALVYVSILVLRCGIFLRICAPSSLPSLVNYLVCWRFDFLALGIVLAFAEGRIGSPLRRLARESGNFVAALLLLLPLCLIAMCESPRVQGTPQSVGPVL